MTSCIFQPADILLPADADMTKWSVIACDQFTSDSRYWQQAEALVGEAPSTLRLMLPEYYLGKCDEALRAAQIQAAMRDYLESGVFRTLPHSFVYVERTLPGGEIRRGLVGQIDLEAYDFAPDSQSPVRATEGTVESRLPPRVQVRADAALEMPHIMLFCDDAEDSVMACASDLSEETLYDFDLMLGGGHITGRLIQNENADKLAQLLAKKTSSRSLQFAVGDGNHSLAAARQLWVKIKEHLTPAQQAASPARYALAELVNIHDASIVFEPIHRVLFHTDAASFLESASRALGSAPSSYGITILSEGTEHTIPVEGATVGTVIERTEAFCKQYITEHGGEIDYIHGEPETRFLASGQDAVGILLPTPEKAELFSSVECSGPFPRKSFSIGLGPDKRYYLECRKL